MVVFHQRIGIILMLWIIQPPMPPSPQTEIKNLAHAMVKLYIDARIKKIEEHNAHVLECVQQDTMDLREATRGWGLVVCPECMEDVPWGSIMLHRTGLCKNCRV